MGQQKLEKYLKEKIEELEITLEKERKKAPDAFDENGDAKPAMQCYADFELWDCGNFDDVFQAGCDFTDNEWFDAKLQDYKNMLKLLQEME